MLSYLLSIFKPKPRVPLKKAGCGCVVKGGRVVKMCEDAKWIFNRKKNCTIHGFTHSTKMYSGDLNKHLDKAINEVK